MKYQPFEVESWSRGTLSVKIGTDLNNLLNVKSVSLAHAPVKANVKLELVDMGNGLEEDYIKNPGKVTTEPFALKIAAPPVFVSTSKSTRICIFLASDICDAMVRFQIKS